MKKKIIAIVAALGISLTAIPAQAQFWGGYGGYGGYGGWGYGGGAAIAGMAIGGLLAGSMMAQTYGYPYVYGAPVYGAYGAGYGGYGYGGGSPRVKKNIIIKNSPGATVIEEDDIFGGW